ncbi:hypothetical protein BH10BDE1_BH10BDE1_05070 [soil metagenome]
MNFAALVPATLIGFGTYHFLVGVPSVLSLRWLRKVGSFFYKLKISENPDPQFEYVLKPLGLYALFVSFVSFLMATEADPKLQRCYLLICAFLLIARGVCRLAYRQLFVRAFATSPGRNRANAFLTFALGAYFIALFALTN